MKAISLISGGIDSPVATHLMIKQGLEIIFVHFDNRPFTDGKGTEKTKKLVKKLAKIHKKKFKLFIMNHGPVQEKILKNCDHQKLCILCRRMMLRVSEKIAEKEKALALVTGENLGQVASQTLENLIVERKAVQIPILQPLLGFDKEETIEIAKKIGTFDISIGPGHCCTVVPKYPETRAVLKEIEAEEKKINLNKLVSESLKLSEVLEL